MPDPSPPVNLARLARPVTSLGPGRRLALWVAGCRLDCPGCISPDLRHPGAGKPISVERLAAHILALPEALDGLSLSGGEPFDQADALGALWQRLRPARPHWDLLIFTGYPLRHLRGRPEAHSLLGACDLLVAGPYRAERPGRQPLQASANQGLHALTGRGEAMLAALGRDRVPVNLARESSGRGWLIGVPGPRERRHLHRRLGLSSLLATPGEEALAHD